MADLTAQDILNSLPEVVRRRRAASQLRGAADASQNLIDAPGAGNYAAPSRGSWYDTVQQWRPDYQKALQGITGGIGKLYYDKKAASAEDEATNYSNQQSAEALQQLGGGGDNATSTLLRGYLGMIGGPSTKEFMSKPAYVQSTKVDKDGKVWGLMSDGTKTDMGITADYAGRIVTDADGNQYVAGTSGAGRGVTTPVTAGQPEAAAPDGLQTAADGSLVYINPNIPDRLRDVILQNPNASNYKVPADAGPRQLRSLTKGEEAAKSTQAKIDVEAANAGKIAAVKGAETAAAETAKNTAAAQAALPKILRITDSLKSAAGALKEAKGLDEIVGGSIWSRLPDKVTDKAIPLFQAGSPTADAYAKYKKLMGANFMTAFQELRGAGQITEQEGAKAEAAFARLQRSQTRKQFTEALDELIDLANEIQSRSKSLAGNSAPAAKATPALPAGFSWED